MRTIQRILWITTALLPLFFYGCEKGKQHVELPPPTTEIPGGEDPGGGNNPGGETPGGSSTHSGPWDENRGKVVTPSGEGWTSKTVREGIVYYAFSGTDAISGQPQKIFAVDLDLSNPKYELKLTRSASAVYTSEVHKNYNAIATINAGYEAPSIYIRSEGKDFSVINNVQIGDTGQDNWKSEGAFYLTSSGEPGIVFVGSPKRDGVVSGIKGGSYADACKKQREYYQGMKKTSYPYLLSSAPLMIDDYEPLGDTFCDFTISESQANALNSENLEHHQRVRHPRTAIGITENKHFIMLVVDGRRTTRKGMSCKELTDFMVKWFNPQWALNLDGGGSTTMCVENLGDSRNVVNSPIDGSVNGQERKRDTHIVILAK